MTLNNDFMYILFISVKTREGGTWADPGERARVPGEQADEEDRETGERDPDQTKHPGTGKYSSSVWHLQSNDISL